MLTKEEEFYSYSKNFLEHLELYLCPYYSRKEFWGTLIFFPSKEYSSRNYVYFDLRPSNKKHLFFVSLFEIKENIVFKISGIIKPIERIDIYNIISEMCETYKIKIPLKVRISNTDRYKKPDLYNYKQNCHLSSQSDWREYIPKLKKYKPPKYDDDFIYFIQERGCDLIKIGFSNNPRKRLKALQVANPHKLLLLYAFPSTRDFETKIHNKLRSQRVRGEWYFSHPDVRAFIGTLHKTLAQIKAKNPNIRTIPDETLNQIIENIFEPP